MMRTGPAADDEARGDGEAENRKLKVRRCRQPPPLDDLAEEVAARNVLESATARNLVAARAGRAQTQQDRIAVVVDAESEDPQKDSCASGGRACVKMGNETHKFRKFYFNNNHNNYTLLIILTLFSSKFQ